MLLGIWSVKRIRCAHIGRDGRKQVDNAYKEHIVIAHPLSPEQAFGSPSCNHSAGNYGNADASSKLANTILIP